MEIFELVYVKYKYYYSNSMLTFSNLRALDGTPTLTGS